MSRSHADVLICLVNFTFNAFMLPFKIRKMRCSVTMWTTWHTQCGVASISKCIVLVCRRCFRWSYTSPNGKGEDEVTRVHREQWHLPSLLSLDLLPHCPPHTYLQSWFISHNRNKRKPQEKGVTVLSLFAFLASCSKMYLVHSGGCLGNL